MKKLCGILFIFVSLYSFYGCSNSTLAVKPDQNEVEMLSNVINVYGPGGPYPAMNAVAEAFTKETGIEVNLVKGPTHKWLEQAKKNADMIYSGGEFMMQDFIWSLDGAIDEKTVMPLFVRPSGLLVRPGNPKLFENFEDILVKDVKVLIVNGAGQTGLWEDMAGKKGNVDTIKKLRKNIVYQAKNSAEAKKMWIEDESLDVWIIWNIWQISNPTIADFVEVSDDYVIYRDCGVALTNVSSVPKKQKAKQFYDFLQTKQAEDIFNDWGWDND